MANIELMWEEIRQGCKYKKMVHWRLPCNSLPQGWFLSLATHRDLLVSTVLQELNSGQCLWVSTEPRTCVVLVLITVLHFDSVSDTWKSWGSSFAHSYNVNSLIYVSYFSFWSTVRREESQNINWKCHLGCKFGSTSSPFPLVRSSISLFQPSLERPFSHMNPSPSLPLWSYTTAFTGQSAPVSVPWSCSTWNNLAPSSCMSTFYFHWQPEILWTPSIFLVFLLWYLSPPTFYHRYLHIPQLCFGFLGIKHMPIFPYLVPCT